MQAVRHPINLPGEGLGDNRDRTMRAKTSKDARLCEGKRWMRHEPELRMREQIGQFRCGQHSHPSDGKTMHSCGRIERGTHILYFLDAEVLEQAAERGKLIVGSTSRGTEAED